MIALPIQKDRTIIFNQTVDLSSIGTLSESILKINEDDEYIASVYALHGLQYTPKPIKVYIDSYGGLVYQCLGLLSIMENSKTPLHTIVTGCAMSCGFMMAISGHKRYAYKNATFMYHQVSGVEVGKMKDLEAGVIEGKRLQKIIEEHTMSKTDIPKDRIKEVYEKKIDWYMTADEALKLKVIDEIL